MYASLEDITAWLRDDKVKVSDANSKQPNIDAGRIIRARLSGVFVPAVLNTWDSPATTPELIRSIAGRLAAAYLYRSLFSAESDEVSVYAQQLWNEAMMVINDIREGDTTVVDADNNPIDTTGSNLLSFFPNNSTQPLFSVNDVFS
jgi:hypothetical protein